MKDPAEKRDVLLRKFAQCSNFVRGSINRVCGKCNRANCICDTKTRRKAYRLTYKDSQQKTRIVYVARDRLPEIKRMLANYVKSRKIIEKLIETNLEIFKTGSGL